MTVNPIPDDYPRIAAALVADGAADAIEFYTSVLGLTERMRFDEPDGRVGHSELQLGDSLVMVSDEYPGIGVVAPTTVGGTPVSLNVYVEDADATFARALAAGASELRPVEDRFYGDRSGQFLDPWGHRWAVASRVRDISPEEMQQGAQELMAEGD